MIRRFPEPALRMLHTFFQTCWTTGNIPKDWKKATVVAIPKNGKPPQQTSSYRPIALTPHLGKVYKRVLKNRLDHHLEKNEILPLCQAGFRKGRNCMEHVVRLIEDTKKWSLKGKNKKTVATFFDIKKAFDSVWHAKLLNKMGALGITGRMYNFIQTFLDSREITVKPPTLPTTTTSHPEEEVYRLPSDLKPVHYDLEIAPDLYGSDPSTFSFRGHVNITLECQSPTRQVILNAQNMSIPKADIVVSSPSSGNLQVVGMLLNDREKTLTISLGESLQWCC
ncbi:hypothetical protein ACOMHN_019025 [Nucella lapillus]